MCWLNHTHVCAVMFWLMRDWSRIMSIAEVTLGIRRNCDDSSKEQSRLSGYGELSRAFAEPTEAEMS